MTHLNGKYNSSESENETTIVPVVQYEAGRAKCFLIPEFISRSILGEFLHFDIPQSFEILVVAGQDDKVADLPAMIIESFRRSVWLLCKQFLKHSDLKVSAVW